MFEIIGIKLATMLISLGMDKAGNWVNKKLTKKNLYSIEDIKKHTQVLFVDDEDFSVLLETIRSSGWNVKQVYDILNFNSEEVKSADIIFMDFIGVGKTLTPKEQGIGLLKSLKKRYPKKFIVFYSGYAGFIPGHEVHAIADAWIDKHADPFVYIDQIEVAAMKIYGTEK